MCDSFLFSKFLRRSQQAVFVPILCCLFQPGFTQDAPSHSPTSLSAREISPPLDSGPEPLEPAPLVPPENGGDPLNREVVAPDHALGLAEVLELGQKHNSAIRTSQANLRAAYFAYRQAGSLPSGALTLGTQGGSGPASVNSYSGTSYDAYAQLNQSFGPIGSLQASRRSALRTYYVSLAQLKLSQLQVEESIKDAYYTLLGAQLKLRVAQGNLRLSERIFEVANSRFRAGAGPRLDLLNAQVQRNRSRQQIFQAQGALTQAQARLAPLLGLPGHTSLSVEGALGPVELPLEYPALLEKARLSPRAESDRQALEKSKWDLRAARSQGNPTPGVQATYDISSSSYVLGGTLSIPIDWGQLGYASLQAEQQIKAAAATLQSTLLAISSDLQNAYSAYRTALQSARIFRTDILSPQEESTSITQFGFQRGALPYAQLLTTQQQLVSIRAEYIDLLVSVQMTLDSLETAAGTRLLEPAARTAAAAENNPSDATELPDPLKLRPATPR